MVAPLHEFRRQSLGWTPGVGWVEQQPEARDQQSPGRNRLSLKSSMARGGWR